MRAVVISEEVFDKLFEETLKELELDKLREKDRIYSTNIETLHRKFHYTICVLKDRLIKA